jgi:hypothetical protein
MNKLNKGDIVTPNNDYYGNKLSQNKQYEVISYDPSDDTILIKCDFGIGLWFSANQFTNITEYSYLEKVARFFNRILGI